MASESQTVVITGAASGIGMALYQRLVDQGAEVYALDRSVVPAAGSAVYVPCDLTNPSAIAAAAEALPDSIDLLVHVAGAPGTLDQLTVMQVNLLGLRCLTEHLAQRLADGGRIISVASISGANWRRRLTEINALLDTTDFDSGNEWCREHPRTGQDAYAFSKECVVVLGKRLAGLGIQRGFTSNTVSPGPVETPLLPTFHEQEYPGQIDWVIGQIGKPANTAEIIDVVEFLASDAARWINGQDIQVDRGFMAGIDSGWIDAQGSPANQAKAAKARQQNDSGEQ